MSVEFSIRDAVPDDMDAIARLNNSELPHVTAISADAVRTLSYQAFYFRVAEDSSSNQLLGFLLALGEGATYFSLNFQWFKKRYSRFIYIDRIVVSRRQQRHGVGKFLYGDLIEKAQGLTPLLTCEVNIRPPNPGSLEFHHRFSFREVGTQDTENGKKTVSLMLKDLGGI